MPSASEKASAMAIVKIPPMTASRECVPACRPTIRPSVVMMPEVEPKLTPVLNDSLIFSPPISLKTLRPQAAAVTNSAGLFASGIAGPGPLKRRAELDPQADYLLLCQIYQGGQDPDP